MATEFDLTALFPQPQRVEYHDGTTEMCSDVRLATSNVLPFMRKTMRTVFSGANIRIVANKKKFVIHVNIVDEDDLDFADCPLEVREDFYRMSVQDNVVTISAASQVGAVWGTQTFASLYKATGHEVEVPNMEIADWASFPMRGLLIPADDVAAEMHLDEWCSLLDRLGEGKLNRLIVELLGTQNMEYLMVRLSDDEEWRPEGERRYYSPSEQDWKSEPFSPIMFADDFYGDYATSASERGIQLIPALSLFVNSSIIPQLAPAMLGKDAEGKPADGVCCFTSAEAREQMEELYSFFLDRYYPDGAPALLLQFDRLPLLTQSDAWCQCEECRAQSPETNVTSLALWMASMLATKGVDKIILRNTSRKHHFNVLTPEFVESLQKAGLQDRVIVQPAVSVGDKGSAVLFGEISSEERATWPGLGLSYCNCLASCPAEDGIKATVRRSQSLDGLGTATTAAADPFARETDRAAGGVLWNSATLDDTEEGLPPFLPATLGPYASDYYCAWQTLSNAAKGSPTLQACCLCGPAEAEQKVIIAMTRLSHIADAQGQLQKISTAAQAASECLGELAKERDKEEKLIRTTDLIATLSLLAEAIRTKAVADTFIKLLPISDNLRKGEIDKKSKEIIKEARQHLLQAMQETAEHKPRYAVPAALMHLSVLLAYLEAHS